MINNNKFSRYLSGLNFFEKLYNKNLLLVQDEKLKEFTKMTDEQIYKLRVTAMQGWFEKHEKPSVISNSSQIRSGIRSKNDSQLGSKYAVKKEKEIYELYNQTFSKEDNVLTGFKTKKKGFVIKKKKVNLKEAKAQTTREMIAKSIKSNQSYINQSGLSNMSTQLGNSTSRIT